MTNPWDSLLNQPTSKHNNNGVIPLSDYRIITVTGPDAFTFLQGQCTCDFTPITQSQWVRGAHCNPKGRMLSSFVAAQIAPQTIGLRVHHSIATQAHSALSKYLVFSKAQCALSQHIAVGLEQKALNKLGLSLAPGKAEHSDAGLLLSSEHTAELWLEGSAFNEVFNPFITQAAPKPFGHSALWQQLMITQGIADVTEHTSEQFLPQAFNYDAIGAVSFKKGCYTGQEIIARLHYKGQSKQRLHQLQSHGQAEVGQPVVNDAQKVVGHVIHCTGKHVLACTTAFTGNEPLYLGCDGNANALPCDTENQPLTPVALPYTLPQN